MLPKLILLGCDIVVLTNYQFHPFIFTVYINAFGVIDNSNTIITQTFLKFYFTTLRGVIVH